MGGNMTRRLVDGGHEVVAWDQNVAAVQTIGRSGATGAASISDLVSKLTPPRAIWVMVPRGRSHRTDGHGACRTPAARRHDHRWRQHPFQRRRSPRVHTGATRHSLSRRWYKRRRLGRRARVLPDDRRAEHAATRLIPIFARLRLARDRFLHRVDSTPRKQQRTRGSCTVGLPVPAISSK
jgi:hypothetical protein